MSLPAELNEAMKKLSVGGEGSVFGDIDNSKHGLENFMTFDDDAVHGKEFPSLANVTIVKGDAPKEGQIVVVLFWGQYHKPGYAFLPLYSKLQAKYGDKVCVMGISIDPAVEGYVDKFIEDPGKKYSTVFPCDFTMAWDNSFKDSMRALLNSTLDPPHSFILVDNKIVWHQDHSQLGAVVPTYMPIIEHQLDQLVAGKPLHKVGNRPEKEPEPEEEGEACDVVLDGDADDPFAFM